MAEDQGGSHADYDYFAARPPTRIDHFRAGVGVVARAVMWLCVWFIVLHAFFQAIHEGGSMVVTAIFALAFFPATFFIYPFVAPPGAQAWPFPDGTSFIPFLVIALVAHAISTVIGGMEPVD